MMNKLQKISMQQGLNLWPGSTPSRIYEELIKLSVSYSNHDITPNEYVEDFFEWCGVNYQGKTSYTTWPDAIHMCTSFLLDDNHDETFH